MSCKKELNLTSYNDGGHKYDIHELALEHEKIGESTSLTKEEVVKLKEILNTIN